MSEEQFKKVKFGDVLSYTGIDGKILVRVKGKYSFAGGGRIAADVISKDSAYIDCDAPYSCFDVIE